MRITGPVVLLLAAALVGGCAAAPRPSPTPIPSPTPSPTPSPAAQLAIEVMPPEEPAASRMAIPGSPYCFLVTVSGSPGVAPVEIAATAEGATILRITPTSLGPGVVGEDCVAADPADAETSGSVTITATHEGDTRAAVRSLPVFPMADERAADARPHFERWVAWLAEEHPEYGITPDEAVEPVFVSTLLVVSHYSYWFEDWEMTVSWHNMIAPHDWSEVHLRRRGGDAAPSIAFKVDSVSGLTDPYAIEPPEVVVR
jgi:hypothetical protein